MKNLLLMLLALTVFASCEPKSAQERSESKENMVIKLKDQGTSVDVFLPYKMSTGDTILVEYSPALGKYVYKQYKTSETEEAVVVR